jgi:hypothetical protein
MRVLSVTWNNELDKTKVTYTNEYSSEDWIVKLDILTDVISELTDQYNAILEMDWDARKKHAFKQEKQK